MAFQKNPNSKTQRAIAYFRKHFAGRPHTRAEAVTAICREVNCNPSNIYRMWEALQEIDAECRTASSEPPPAAPQATTDTPPLEIPTNLAPDARDCVTTLLNNNIALASKIQVAESDIAAMREQIIVLTKRNTFLKEVASRLIGAV